MISGCSSFSKSSLPTFVCFLLENPSVQCSAKMISSKYQDSPHVAASGTWQGRITIQSDQHRVLPSWVQVFWSSKMCWEQVLHLDTCQCACCMHLCIWAMRSTYSCMQDTQVFYCMHVHSVSRQLAVHYTLRRHVHFVSVAYFVHYALKRQ